MPIKAIMYHYVREYDDKHPYFRFLDISNFRKQLDFFEKEYGFLTKQEWLNFVKFGSTPNKSEKIVLTFDDSMSCHYNYVFPELIRRNLWGIFYIPTYPFLNNKILDVHRIHLLCGAFTGKTLCNSLGKFITDKIIPDQKREEFRTKTYSIQQNYDGVSEFKRILNYFIDYKYREIIIDKVATDLGYVFDPQNFYISIEQALEMKDNGMIIGSHTNSHPVMSKLDFDEQSNELNSSFEFLVNNNLVTENKTYCHPYGGFHSFNDNTVKILNNMDISYSFNVEPRDIVEQHFYDSKQYLPRYDCNLFPFGKAS